MRLRRFVSVVILAVCLVLSSAALAFASVAPASVGGSIVGTVTDSYVGAPLSGMKVALVDYDRATVEATTTSADGSYRFDGLTPASYFVYFSDPTDHYWPQWYDWSDTIWDATPIDVAGGVTYHADAGMVAFQERLLAHFAPADVSVGTTSPLVGTSIELFSDASDSMTGESLSDLKTTLETSIDRIHWTSAGSAVEDPYTGTYYANVFANSVGVHYFRFAVGDSIGVVATASADVAILERPQSRSWSAVTLDGTSTVTTTTVVNRQMQMAATLVDQDHAPVASARVVHLQYSSNGVDWIDEGGLGRSTTPTGSIAVTVTAGPWTFYRFAAVASTYVPATYSAPVTIRAPWLIGTPDTLPLRAVKAKKKFLVIGAIWPRYAANGNRLVKVELQRLNGTRWVGAGGGWAACAVSAYKYHPTLKAKGKYRVRGVAVADTYRLSATSGYYYFAVK